LEKRQTAAEFRRRLHELLGRSGVSQARFAARAGLDRSTLSQLLSEKNLRLPRAETIVQIARRHSASIDWLLGLSEEGAVTPDIVPQPVIEADADNPANDKLRRWHEEARGSKIRYVPSAMPDQLKTEAVIAYENAKLSLPAAVFMSNSAHDRIAHARDGGSEIEVCTPVQRVESFARGEGLWKHLPLRERRRQLSHMADLIENYYPAYRWFLFDGRERYATPYTVFGTKRAVIYMGSLYFVFTASDHIRQLIQHFEDLIRQARIQPNDTASFIRRLLKDIA
jgi:transcriptional regulator with XRE-family HTH domain